MSDVQIFTGREAFDACHTRMTVARNLIRDMAHQADGDDRHPIRLALVQAVEHMDRGLEQLTTVFGVDSLFGADSPALADEDCSPAVVVHHPRNDLAGRRIVANKAAGRHERRAS